MYHFLEHMLSPSLLITSPARASWGFCLIRDAWGLCLHCADERSAVKRQTAWKQKDSFSCASHIGAISKTAVPLPGVPNSSTWSLLSPSHPPCLLLIYENIKRGRKGPTKVVQRTGDMFYQATPPVYCLLCSFAPRPPSSSDNWHSGAAELSSHHRGCTPVTSSQDWSGHMTFQHPQI